MIIYRGVNWEMHLAGQGLRPRGCKTTAKSFLGHGHYGDGQTHGLSERNAAFAHQHQPQAALGFVSFSKDRERARHYALQGGKVQRGVIYEIDTNQLSALGICFLDLTSSLKTKLQDAEVLVKRPDGTCLPLEVISSMTEVWAVSK